MGQGRLHFEYGWKTNNRRGENPKWGEGKFNPPAKRETFSQKRSGNLDEPSGIDKKNILYRKKKWGDLHDGPKKNVRVDRLHAVRRRT